jgi:hypothetical protein
MVQSPAWLLLSLLPVIALGACAPAVEYAATGCRPEEVILHTDGSVECHGTLYASCTDGWHGHRYWHGGSCVPAESSAPALPETSPISVSGSPLPDVVSGSPPPNVVSTSPAPTGAAGFSFGIDATAAAKRCTDAGNAWDANEGGRSVCSGTPASIGMDASARLRFCDGKACSVTLFVRLAEGEPAAWVRRYLSLQDTLAARYGAPAAKDEHIGSDCAVAVGPCLEGGKIALSSYWRWGDGDAIRLTLGRIEGAPSNVAIGIVYSDATLAKGSPKAEGL